MQLCFFSIPQQGGEAAAEDLNRFLAGHRILAVDRHFVADGAHSAWAVCVAYEAAGEGRSTVLADKGRRAGIVASIMSAGLAPLVASSSSSSHPSASDGDRSSSTQAAAIDLMASDSDSDLPPPPPSSNPKQISTSPSSISTPFSSSISPTASPAPVVPTSPNKSSHSKQTTQSFSPPMTFDSSSTAVLELETDLDLTLSDLDSILEFDVTDSVTGPGGANQTPV
jgi:hypothetical protein